MFLNHWFKSLYLNHRTQLPLTVPHKIYQLKKGRIVLEINQKLECLSREIHSVILDAIIRILEVFVGQTADKKFHVSFPKEKKNNLFALGRIYEGSFRRYPFFTMDCWFYEIIEYIRDLIRDKYNTHRDWQTYKFHFYRKTYFFS